MKVLVTGVRGQLGHDVMKELAARGIPAVGADIGEFDLTDRAATEAFVLGEQPDVIVHCAAFTAVDKAESEKELCRRVNVDGTANIAACAKKLDAKLVYISTDYVFDGQGEVPFEADSPANPINFYGESKWLGEQAVRECVKKAFIIRVSWVFGLNGGNFVKTMLRLAETRNEQNVVGDQIGSPTYTPDLSRLIADMIGTEQYGTYHATNEGLCSWHEFACKIFEYSNIPMQVNALTSEEYNERFHPAAKRPFNSRLSKKSLDDAGFARLPTWEDALRRYLQELKNQ